MKKLATLGWVFFWISSVTLGGGMAMLPLLDREFVEKHRWLTEDEMLEIVAVMQSLPGLILINMAVLVGFKVKGVVGAVVATVASVLTPFAIIAVIARWAASLSASSALSHVFLGVRAGTAALILMSLVKLSKAALRGALAWTLAVVGFLLAVVVQADITLIVLLGFAVGVGMIAAHALRRARR